MVILFSLNIFKNLERFDGFGLNKHVEHHGEQAVGDAGRVERAGGGAKISFRSRRRKRNIVIQHKRIQMKKQTIILILKSLIKSMEW